jgi:hypothetical protein
VPQPCSTPAVLADSHECILTCPFQHGRPCAKSEWLQRSRQEPRCCCRARRVAGRRSSTTTSKRSCIPSCFHSLGVEETVHTLHTERENSRRIISLAFSLYSYSGGLMKSADMKSPRRIGRGLAVNPRSYAPRNSLACLVEAHGKSIQNAPCPAL